MSADEVIVLNYWASRPLDLAHILGRAAPSRVGDPTGKPPDPDVMFTVVDPAYWATQHQGLREALDWAAGNEARPGGGSVAAPGAIGSTQERLTLTVEEAAQALGISRAFAYEAVRRGDIPHIKIGRRLLIPKAKLDALLNAPSVGEPDPPPSS